MNTLIILSILGLVCLIAEILDFKKALYPIVLIGLIAALSLDVMDWNINRAYFNNMVLIDNFAVAFSGLLIFITILWFIMSREFFLESSSLSDHFALIIFTLIGAVVMTSFSNMIMLFLGIEILSISLYILAGSNKSNPESNEAALKYFLMGAFATGFILFGIALIYGATSSFNLNEVHNSLILHPQEKTILMYSGLFMMMIAMSFKVSAVPFHFWAPDVYQGSPTVITAFMSTVVKSAAFAAFLRLFLYTFSIPGESWSLTLSILSILTIVVGNITAVYQKNFKRMLAYSSISHAGYMILAILARNENSAGSLFYYAAAYSLSSLTSFIILLAVSHFSGNETIESFKGLAKKNPLLAAVTTIAMLSLAGIPPTAGFFAKYYIFSAALQNNFTGVVLVAVLGTLVGVYYYFRVIVAIFSREGLEAIIPLSFSFRSLLIFTTLIALALGILPGLVIGLI